jgi:hypothetical protein
MSGGLAAIACRSSAFLPGVTAKGDWSREACVSAKEFLQFFQLAVGQRVHRIDDDGSGARRWVNAFAFMQASTMG